MPEAGEEGRIGSMLFFKKQYHRNCPLPSRRLFSVDFDFHGIACCCLNTIISAILPAEIFSFYEHRNKLCLCGKDPCLVSDERFCSRQDDVGCIWIVVETERVQTVIRLR